MIRWITETLGTASWTEVKDRADLSVVDVRDMVDKGGNTTAVVREKIEEALSKLKHARKVVIACDYGMSRSNAIAAGILTRLRGVSFYDAAHQVIGTTGERAIKIDVLSKVMEALELEAQHDTDTDFGSQRLLILGARGFIGSALVEALADQFEVYTPTRQQINLLNGAAELDLLVKEKRIDTIVHLANPRVYTNNQAAGETLTMLENVLDVCRENDVRLIYPSGWEVYSGYESQQLLASETLPRFPKGPYGETKHLCEILIETHYRNYGLNYSLLRSSSVYGGVERPRFIYNFIHKALAEDDIWTHHYFNGYPSVDLLHINDLVSAMIKLIKSEIWGAVNIGSGKPYSTTEVANMIIGLLGSGSKVKHRHIEDFAPNIVMDTSYAQSVLDWAPHTNLNDGLRGMIQEVSSM